MAERRIASRPMRFFLLAALSAVISVPAAAQIQRGLPAFQPSIAPFVGVTSFGIRQTNATVETSYRGSITIGAQGQIPLTQRVGLLGTVAISPIAKQRVETTVTTDLRDNVVILRGDLALGWRFIPRAPVYFFGGGGIIRASKPAFPEFEHSVTEPRGLFGFGYDRASERAWNFRFVATGFVTKAADVDAATWQGAGAPPPVEAKSAVFDWSVEIGARYRFNRGS